MLPVQGFASHAAELTIALGEIADTGVSAGSRPLIRNERPVSVFVGASSEFVGEVFCKVIVKVVPEIAKLADAVTALPPTLLLSVKTTAASAAPFNANTTAAAKAGSILSSTVSPETGV